MPDRKIDRVRSAESAEEGEGNSSLATMKLPTWHASGNREQAWRNSMNGIGRKLMASMGWKEGETLGRNENGLVKCLQPDAEDPEKRTKGIGAKTSIHSSNWWEAAFNDAASSIGKAGSKGKKRKANGDEKEERGTKKKKKEKKKRKQATNRDGTDTSATADELRIVENLSKQRWGFTGGREGKMERIRRQEQEFLSKVQSEKKSEGGAGGKKTSTSGGVSAKKKRKAKTKSDEKELHRIEACEAKRVEYSAAAWWGSKIFSFSGVLGRLERKPGAQDEGLTEKDQVKAFFKAKENAADGKGGIGSKFIDIKLGEEFQGQKITFGGAEAAKEDGEAGQGEGDGLKDKKKKKKDKKKDKKAKSKKSKKSKK